MDGEIGWMDGWMDIYMCRQMDRYIYGIDRQTGRHTYIWIDKLIDRHIDT